MMDHEDVWNAIDQLASKKGLSPSALARTAGLDPTTFNKSKRHAADGRPRWPSTESIAKVLRATDTSITELFAGHGVRANGVSSLTVPLMGTAQDGTIGVASPASVQPASMLSPSRIIHFPDQRYEPMYALKVVGDALLPLYRDGDVLFATTAFGPQKDDRIVVKLTNGDLLVRVFEFFDGLIYSLGSVNAPSDNLLIGVDRVDYVAKIVYATQ